MPATNSLYPSLDREDDGTLVLKVALDGETVVRLLHAADMAHADPAQVVAAIVHDVLEDDELAHLHADQPSTLN